ncbi:TPA: hypothetical protein ACXPYA_005426 [Klebsiella variicola subsp. variicola]
MHEFSFNYAEGYQMVKQCSVMCLLCISTIAHSIQLPDYQILDNQAIITKPGNQPAHAWNMFYIDRKENKLRSCSVLLYKPPNNSAQKPYFITFCQTKFEGPDVGNLADSYASLVERNIYNKEGDNYADYETWLLNAVNGEVRFCWSSNIQRCRKITDQRDKFDVMY